MRENSFILLGNSFILIFLLEENSFIFLGNSFILLGNSFILVGNSFTLVGNSFILVGNSFILLLFEFHEFFCDTMALKTIWWWRARRRYTCPNTILTPRNSIVLNQISFNMVLFTHMLLPSCFSHNCRLGFAKCF